MGFLIETDVSHRETENSQAEKLRKLTEDPWEDRWTSAEHKQGK